MRIAAFVLAAGLVACSGKMQPGTVGTQLDMRQYLPDSLRSVAAAESSFHQEIAVGPKRARVELTWTMFRHGSGRYLSSVSARLLDPVRYDSLTLEPVSELRNVGTKFEPSESAKLALGWSRTILFVRGSGQTPFEFDAIGRRTVYPAQGN